MARGRFSLVRPAEASRLRVGPGGLDVDQERATATGHLATVPAQSRMSIQGEVQATGPQHETIDWVDHGSNFILIAEGKPPSRIALARERMLVCRLYVGLLQTITDDYGAEFAADSDSLAYRTIGIYVFLRTVMCSPARASQIAHALRLPRAAVLRNLHELVKKGFVERVGNAYRVTDKVNIPDLQNKLRRRINMITETAKKLSRAGSDV